MGMSDLSDRRNIRWYCPECKRIDPRHPKTKPNEMPDSHTSHMGLIQKSYIDLCNGIRIPQRFNEETQTWSLDNQ
jgi:hypothetical protein